MIDYSNIGKDGIVKDGIFNRFEILRPAFLDNYWNNPKHRKLMIVAESNYFKDGTDSIYKDPQTWYLGEDEPVKQFLEKQKKSLSNWKEYKTFSKLCKSMNEISGLQCNSVYEEAIFYNYFLRPATVLGANRSFEKDGVLQLFSQNEMDQIYSTVFFSLVEEIKEYKKLYIPVELINSLGMEQGEMPILKLVEEEGGVFLKPADPHKSLARFLVPRISTHGKSRLKMLYPVLSISGGNEDE